MARFFWEFCATAQKLLAELYEGETTMPDGFVRIRKGEIRPVYGQETMLTGTLAIQASPPPTATLTDATGATVAGFEEIGASGRDPGASVAPRVWLNFDTATIPVGYYNLTFTFTALSSDGGLRRYRPSLEIQVTEA